MSFNSLNFLIFFPVVTVLYFLLPHRFRWILLLGSSVFFYMAFIPAYILILLVTILIDYFAGIFIAKTSGGKRKIYLVVSIISTCLVLFIFKYFNFFNANLTALSDFLHWNYGIGALQIALPIGLSFHTFQSLSYVIEVYRGRQKVEKNFGIYSLYVMFYPQLVSGPIERPQNLLHQFYENHQFEASRVINGLKLMAWGMFKKVVVADRLALFVGAVYGDAFAWPGLALALATIFFAFQIYADFSGYSDIAIGAAQVMGFKIMDNFNRPYASRSVGEFWKRWHISLSTWFRDYLYISLGGNRVSKLRWAFNILVTFLVSGFWHGANWTYVVWGGLHGFYMLFSVWTGGVREKIRSYLSFLGPKVQSAFQVAVSFALITFAWIFFRAPDLSSAWYIAGHLFSGFTDLIVNFLANPSLGSASVLRPLLLGQTKWEFVTAVAAIIFMEAVQYFERRGSARTLFLGRPALLRWSFYAIVALAILNFGIVDQIQFIYFQF